MAWHTRDIDRHRARIASGLVSFTLNEAADQILACTRGNANAAAARQIAMYLTYVGFGISYSRVAAAFERDRSTVAHACHQIEDRREDEVFNSWMEGLEDVLRQLKPLCERIWN